MQILNIYKTKVAIEFIWRKIGLSCGLLFSGKPGNGKCYGRPRQQTEGGGKMGDQVNSLSEKKSHFMPSTNSKLRDK